jgi:two-component response regulator (ARR-A family)
MKSDLKPEPPMWFSEPSLQDVGVNLIITDYCMPGMTGYDLLRRVKVKRFAEPLFIQLFSLC